MLSLPARPISKLHLDDLVLLAAKCPCGFTHFVMFTSTQATSVTSTGYRYLGDAQVKRPRELVWGPATRYDDATHYYTVCEAGAYTRPLLRST